MQVRACETTYPTIRVVSASVAKHLCTSRHALTKFFWKCAERGLAHAKRSQARPREGNRHPVPFGLGGGCTPLGRRDLTDNACEPRPSAGRLLERKKFVSASERWYSRDQNV